MSSPGRPGATRPGGEVVLGSGPETHVGGTIRLADPRAARFVGARRRWGAPGSSGQAPREVIVR